MAPPPDMPGGWELALIAALFMLMFGMKRLPSAARDFGRSLHILRKEVVEPLEKRDETY